MRENRLSGSEGGATFIASSLPLSTIQSLRDEVRQHPTGRVFFVADSRQSRGRGMGYQYLVPTGRQTVLTAVRKIDSTSWYDLPISHAQRVEHVLGSCHPGYSRSVCFASLRCLV